MHVKWMHTPSEPEARRSAVPAERVSYSRLLWVAPLTALAAALAAALVFTVAAALGAISPIVRVPSPLGLQPLTLASVAITAIIATVWAAIVFAFVGLFASRPISVFRIVALVVLILSFTLPFTVAGIPPLMLASLLLMHVVVAAIDVGLLTTLGGRSVRHHMRRN